MTWLEVARQFDENIEPDDVEFILWNETAFPLANIRKVIDQMHSAIRRRKNNIVGCDFCGQIKCHCLENLRECRKKLAK